ncbi:MAG: hypothetical protein PHS37_05665, partial [Candidatus Omnitrophica bacterium]|nr:hypothetical protein [Candidatus Omnitrophota bacterium]
MIKKILVWGGDIVLLIIIVIGGYLYARSGDFILKYLMRQIDLELVYQDRCDFTSACIFKEATLNHTALKIPGVNASIESAKAHVTFDYSRIIDRKAIRLIAVLDEPYVKIDDKKVSGAQDVLSGLLPET